MTQHGNKSSRKNYLRFGSFIFFQLISLSIGALTMPAFAQVPHDLVVSRSDGQDITLLTSTDYIRFYADAGSSYACEVLSVGGPANGFYSAPVRVRPNNGFDSSTTISSRLCGSDNPRVGVDAQRICFIVPATISYPLVEVDVGWTGTYPANVRVTCDETTLYSGFNTSVTNFNFLELTNTLDRATTESSLLRDLTATVTAVNTVPNPDVTVINGTAYSVPANSRTDVDIHSVAGAGAFGPVKIAHNGAPGSIKAVVSQYNITSTNPFAFAPVAQEVALTRGQLAGVNR